MALTTNILASWKFDESSGNASDSSGNGKTLTNTNSISYVSGKVNNAWDFWSANSTKYFTISDFLTLNTYQAWVWSIRRPVQITTAPASWETQNLFGICDSSKAQVNIGYTNNGGTMQIQYIIYNWITAQTMTWNTTFTTGVWYDVWIVKNGTTVTAYRDWSSLWTQTITIADASPARANQFTLGRDAFNNGNFMKGLVDEVTAYSDAKTWTDVTDAYNGWNWLSYPFISSVFIPKIMII
jgi:Concanavalin A-like lectin/glucanases superfamily